MVFYTVCWRFKKIIATLGEIGFFGGTLSAGKLILANTLADMTAIVTGIFLFEYLRYL